MFFEWKTTLFIFSPKYCSAVSLLYGMVMFLPVLCLTCFETIYGSWATWTALEWSVDWLFLVAVMAEVRLLIWWPGNCWSRGSGPPMFSVVLSGSEAPLSLGIASVRCPLCSLPFTSFQGSDVHLQPYFSVCSPRIAFRAVVLSSLVWDQLCGSSSVSGSLIFVILGLFLGR